VYLVYVLISVHNPERYYIGITSDVDRRLKEHNGAKGSKYSRHYAPWQIETYVVFKNKPLAVSFERYLKSGSGHAFLKRHLLPK